LKNATVATITFFVTTPTKRKKTMVASLQLLPSSLQAKIRKKWAMIASLLLSPCLQQ
jgi:hypothetical protein